MSVPPRYRKLEDFHTYYSDARLAPVLTLVVGGNHEAANYFSELHHGGWLAPNIYYLGAANVLRYGPYRIAGVSGIFKESDYAKPHHERLPYSANDVRSVYHVRHGDVNQLLQVQTPVDMCLSHDWPRRVEWFGDHAALFAARPPFFTSAKIDNLGSPAGEQVLSFLRPRYWFAGHMHVRFSAEVRHSDDTSGDIFRQVPVSEAVRAQLPKSMFRAPFVTKGRVMTLPPPEITNTVTQFLALDKPGPDRDFLELLEISPAVDASDDSITPYTQKTPEGKFSLHYDEEWLSIIRAAYDKGKSKDEHVQWIKTSITAQNLLKIPENFARHAPIYDPDDSMQWNGQPPEYPNSQTEAFRAMLQLQDDDASDNDVGAPGGDNIVFG